VADVPDLDFILAVSDAIGRATAEVVSETPTAFDYRGQTLRYALERDLFIRLTNNAALRSAFSTQSGAVDVETHLEARVASLLVAVPVRVTAPRGRGLIQTLRGLRSPRPHAPGARGGVLVLVDHSKFVPFLRPVLEELAGTPVVLVSATSELADPPVGVQAEVVSLGSLGAHHATSEAVAERGYLLTGYDRLHALAERVRPTSIVTIEGNAPLDDVAARVGRELGIRSVCLQQGWSPLIHTGFRNLSFDQMLVWGEGFADLLRAHNPEQQFQVTGSMVAAQPAPPATERAAVGFFFQGPSPLLGHEELSAFLRLAEDVATRNPDRRILVREHPGYPLDRSGASLSARPNVELVPATSHRLGEVLARCRVAVSVYSTTLLEGIALGAPSVSYNVTELPRYLPDFAAEGAGIEEREHDAALAAIEQLLADDAFLASFAPGVASMRDRYFAGAPTDASKRIAAEISGT
jgi:hypothetical protein